MVTAAGITTTTDGIYSRAVSPDASSHRICVSIHSGGAEREEREDDTTTAALLPPREILRPLLQIKPRKTHTSTLKV